MSEGIPAGFREAPASGLIVPEAHSREREVWTRDEWKLMERMSKLLRSRHITVFLRCDEPGCLKEPMVLVRRATGGISLQCTHKTREFRRDL